MAWLFRLSRPRFWLYIVGPLLVVWGSVYPAFFDWSVMQISLFVCRMCWIFLGANVWIYGVNDYADRDTDRLNEKKQGYESLLDDVDKKKLLTVLGVVLLSRGLLMLATQIRRGGGRGRWVSRGLFYFFSSWYSLPPIRAKARPFLDSLFNILYLLPACAFWYLFYDSHPSFLLLGAGWLWCMAMHCFSAIPDILPDAQAGLRTTAVVLGKERSGLRCSVLYACAHGAVFMYFWMQGETLGLFRTVFFGISMIVYCGISLYASRLTVDTFWWYRLFPWINAVVGFVIFWLFVSG
ncbi:MAG: prenyltransferase [Candidatus Absconditabacterales bacterium]|nr:prenyltransferase [Candidatus Absconditabacterales bacterium]